MFKIFRFRTYYLSIFRGLSICYIVLGYLWINMLATKRFTRRFIPKRYKHMGTVLSTHERLRMVIEKLGPTFIKFGQILADRPDIVSEKFRLELKKLQSAAKPIDDSLAITLIEKELGGPISETFESIDPTCLASASIGQVYKGRLKNSQDVIVKIQRPNIKDKMQLDLVILEYLAKKLAREYPELLVMDVKGFVREFGESLMRELNYFNEASNIIRFEDMFKEVPYCKIPKVYNKYCTHKLLVMEYIEGISPDDSEALLRNGLDPKEVAKNGTHIFLKMIFEHGFFHADPHAGNLFIQENNRVALIDFGMVSSLKPSHMHFLASFTLGLATKNAQRLTEALLKLSGNKFFEEKEDLEFLLQGMLNRYGSVSYEQINFSHVLDECIRIILRFELKIPGSIYMLLKALATIEKLGYKLDNDISLAAYIKPFAVTLIKKEYSPRTIAGDFYDTLKGYVNFIRGFPGEMSEIMHKIKQGKLVHDIQLNNEEVFGRSVKQLGRSISLAFIIGFMLIGSTLIMIYGKQTGLAEFMFIASSVCAIWLMLRLFFKIRL